MSPKSKATTFATKFSAHCSKHAYEDGQSIFAQGDEAHSMFCVLRGGVKLTVTSPHSRKRSISILRTGDCFGESGVLDSSTRRATATSIEQSMIGRIDKREVARRLHNEPTFALLFLRHLLLRTQRVEDDLFDQLVDSSEKRLARLLLQLSDFGKEEDQAHAEVNVDQGTLAEVIGTTRSRVSHFMNGFREQGFIDYKGTLSSLRVHRSLLTFLLSVPATA
jgi:CRP/FNR family cyclic AMP-dependent transcriptional regulator